MAFIKQDKLDVPVITKTILQKFATATALAGVKPSLSSLTAGEQDFVPFVNDVDAVVTMKNPGPTETEGSQEEADAGGLFELDHEQPAVLQQVVGNLSSSVSWSVNLATKNGDIVLASATSAQILMQTPCLLAPGEYVKIICSAPTGKPWVQIYVRSDQARH